MADHQAWITLEECINGYIDEADVSNHKYFKCWQLAFRVMTDLGLDFFYQIKSLKLPILPNFTVALPPDYLKYSKVGVYNSRGEIIPMKYNDKLTSYAQFSPDRLQKTQDDTLFNLYQYNVPVWYNFWDGNTFSNMYGIPSGAPFVGGFKIDNSTGMILLDETFCYEYIALEYVASPQQDQVYYVPIQFKEAIIAGIAWKDIKSIPSKTHVNNANVNMRRHEFYNERRLAWARYRPFNLWDAYEWCQTNVRMTVKI